MQKVEVLPELYIGHLPLIYVVAGAKVFVNLIDRSKPFVPSMYKTVESLKASNPPTAAIKMRWVYVENR